MDEKAPTNTVKIRTHARSTDGFIAKDELQQKPIEAPLVKKIRKNQIKTDADEANPKRRAQLPTRTDQNQQRRNRNPKRWQEQQ